MITIIVNHFWDNKSLAFYSLREYKTGKSLGMYHYNPSDNKSSEQIKNTIQEDIKYFGYTEVFQVEEMDCI